MGALDDEESDIADRRKQFQEYLNRSGVESELTRVLTALFTESEWPDHPISYIIAALRAPPGINVENLIDENRELRERNEELEATVDALMDQIEAFRSVREPAAN